MYLFIETKKTKHPIGTLNTSYNFDAMDKGCDENLYTVNSLI